MYFITRYLVIALGLAQRLDALLLADDDAPVVADLGMGGVAAADGPLAEVVPLEVRAGRQDDVGVLRLTAKPTVLVDDHVELVLAAVTVQLDIAVRLGHGAHEGSAVAPQDLDLALDRILMMRELLLKALAAEAVTDELSVAVHDVFGVVQAVQALLNLAGSILLISGRGLAHL